MNSILTWQEDWRCKLPSVHVSAEVWQRRFSDGLLRAPQIHPAERVSGRAAVLRRPGEQQPAQVGLCICMLTCSNVNNVNFFFLLTWVYAEFVLNLYLNFIFAKSIFLHLKLIEGNTRKVYNNYFPPGACVSTPSSSSLMRTQTGNWALMSFSTA